MFICNQQHKEFSLFLIEFTKETCELNVGVLCRNPATYGGVLEHVNSSPGNILKWFIGIISTCMQLIRGFSKRFCFEFIRCRVDGTSCIVCNQINEYELLLCIQLAVALRCFYSSPIKWRYGFVVKIISIFLLNWIWVRICE